MSRGILFLCVANSSRSQMAEGFARQMAPDGVEVYSAGSAPTEVNPLAVQVMQEVGIDISRHRSKSVASFDHARVGTVITLCAEEVCPILPGNVARFHWPFPDPARVTGSPDERLTAFRRCRDQIRQRLEQYFHDTVPSPQTSPNPR